MGNCEDDFENFLQLAKHLLLLAEKLIADRESAKYVDLEFLYKNFFDEFMRGRPSVRKYLGAR